MTNIFDQQRRLAAAKLENSKRETRMYVYRKWERVLPCEANDRQITAIVDHWIGYDQDVLHTPELFEAAIAENPTDWNSLAKDSSKNIAEQLTDEIIDLLATKGKAHDDFTLKSERVRLGTFTIHALRQRLSDLQRAANLAEKPVQQLKQLVVDARPVPGFPALPRQVFEDGVYRAVNASYLKALEPYALKRMCRIYSTEAVNQRLAEG